MAKTLKITTANFTDALSPVVIVPVADTLTLPEAAHALGADVAALFKAASEAEGFKGKLGEVLQLIAPHNLNCQRLIFIGLGKEKERLSFDAAMFGGKIMGKLPLARDASLLLDFPADMHLSPESYADIALGLRLRAYKFDRYQTKKKADEENAEKGYGAITMHMADPAAAKKALKQREGLAEAICNARDLVNEPPNVLHPEEFARRAASLEKLGIEVEILEPKALKKLGMGALLGVAQGSEFEARVVIMRWNGGAKDETPLAFIGKGVTFDTGGISIKPAGGMEDMKGDMGGAAAVVGTMQALALRKAKINAIGAIGLVENMPDGNAQRPGDIVTSMSGQTIEIINTDAEGRLVLADVLTYVGQEFKPKFMINLATLTGAIMVALGQDYAGMFSNNDTLAENLYKAGMSSGDKLWRMPMGAPYDKMMDSKFADMKNSAASRYGGAISAAQFLQRFVVNDTPWAHLDIAGTAFSSPSSDISQGWASGFGVRLLDKLVADFYE